MATFIASIAAISVTPSTAAAKLRDPTPEEARVAAEKKAQADAQAAKDKQALTASMDALSERWRAKAAANGWAVNPPIPIASPTAAVSAPATQSGSSGQPGGKIGEAGQAAPVTSEKAGNVTPMSGGVAK